MSFKLKTSLSSTTPCTEYFYGTSGESFIYGEALTLSEGKLTKCTGTTKPAFISLGDVSCKDSKTFVPVMRVFDFYIFTCPLTGDADGLNAGDAVTIDSDGCGVTSQTSGGIAEIVEIGENTVSVRFQ